MNSEKWVNPAAMLKEGADLKIYSPSSTACNGSDNGLIMLRVVWQRIKNDKDLNE
jgi:hypothetical protein